MTNLFEGNNVIAQEINSAHGSFRTKATLSAGTNIITRTNSRKAGQKVEGILVYDSIKDIQANSQIDINAIFVPAPFAKGTILKAIVARVSLIICVTESIPIHDMLVVNKALKNSASTLLGLNSPLSLLPGINKIGIIPAGVSLK